MLVALGTTMVVAQPVATITMFKMTRVRTILVVIIRLALNKFNVRILKINKRWQVKNALL